MIKLIIFDYGGTIYNPLTDQLYSGAKEILEKLRPKFKLALVSRAYDVKERLNDFKRFHLEDFFELMEIVPKGKIKDFVHILKKFNVTSKECLVVGDYVKSEIREGNKISIITIWTKNGEFPNVFPENEEEKPNYKIEFLKELIPLVDNLNNS